MASSSPMRICDNHSELTQAVHLSPFHNSLRSSILPNLSFNSPIKFKRFAGREIYRHVLRSLTNIKHLPTLPRISHFLHGGELRDSKIWEDILKFASSPDVYHERYRKAALLAIWKEIVSGSAFQLVEALSKRPELETQLLLSELMRCLGPKWTRVKPESDTPPRSLYRAVGDAYFAMTFYSHPLYPFVDFIALLADHVPTSAQGILYSGILDLVLNIYLQGFLAASKHQPPLAAHRCSALFLTCSRALTNIRSSAGLCSDVDKRADMLNTLSTHPLRALWPRKATMPLSACMWRQMRDRRKAWNALGPAVMSRRLDGIGNVVTASHQDRCEYAEKSMLPVDFPSDEMVNTTTDIFDEFIDLIEFWRPGETVARRTISILDSYFHGISASLKVESSQAELVETMRVWILTHCWKPSELKRLPLWSLDRALCGSSPIPLTAHVSRKLKLNGRLRDRSLSIRDKSKLYFASVCTAVLDAYTHEPIAASSSSTSPSAGYPAQPRPAGLTCDEIFDDFPSYDPFCASSGKKQSFIQSWSNPILNTIGMEGPFSARTAKVVYEPDGPGAHISGPFAIKHNINVTPEKLNRVEQLLIPPTG